MMCNQDLHHLAAVYFGLAESRASKVGMPTSGDLFP
jgi:hypothetical protein